MKELPRNRVSYMPGEVVDIDGRQYERLPTGALKRLSVARLTKKQRQKLKKRIKESQTTTKEPHE